ncbi:MAG: mycothiol synthase [Actinobacteria bacterium]|nr:mycothiol synthase [Actinomycetota bacterium]
MISVVPSKRDLTGACTDSLVQVREVLEDASGAVRSIEIDPATDADVRLAHEAGLVLVREVLQLRRPLPLDRSSSVECRPFQPGRDDEAFLRVNNRAFEWHPDQADWTDQQLHQRMAEPWFSARGFLVHEHDGVLDAFCWTKVHPPSGEEPEMGEIYVIGVDPAAHGHGLGTEMVLAGLDHLGALGIGTAMLHVESDNHTALRLYDRLGFHHHSSHQWWEAP